MDTKQRAFQAFERHLAADGSQSVSGRREGAIDRGGNVDPTALPEGPDFAAYGERAHCEQGLGEAGFRDVDARDFTVEFRFDSGVPGLLRFIENGSVRARALYRAQTEEARRSIAEVLGELLEPFQEDGVARVPATAILVSARRP